MRALTNAELLRPQTFSATSTQCSYCGDYGIVVRTGSLMEWFCNCDVKKPDLTRREERFTTIDSPTTPRPSH